MYINTQTDSQINVRTNVQIMNADKCMMYVPRKVIHVSENKKRYKIDFLLSPHCFRSKNLCSDDNFLDDNSGNGLREL